MTNNENLISQKIGKLTVIKLDENRIQREVSEGKRKRKYWLCRCDCGNPNLVSVNQDALIRKTTKSCGCLKSEIQKERIRLKNDLTGLRFGRLLVVCEDIETENIRKAKSKKNISYWLCDCDCGTKLKSIRYDCLTSGNTQSCGCLCKELATERLNGINKTHNLSDTSIYHIYYGMKERCYNKNNPRYNSYGGRDITIDNKWMGDNGFINFYNWSIENGYIEGLGLSVDRINNDKGYSPSNCRWTTNKVQQNNTRFNKIITYNNESKTLSEWAEYLGMTYSKLATRLHRGWSDERAFTTP